MVSQVGALRVTVGANINPLTADMRRAERVVAKSAGTMSRAVQGINKSLSGLGSIAGVTLGGAGLLAGASAFIRVADAAKSMAAQLRLATAEYGSFSKANEDVRRIAEASRTSLTATAELYATIQRNAGELGNTQEQTARITETVNKSFAVFGATAVQAEQATRQLNQAFQSGRLSGDEFRTLMENAPRLMKLLADSLGVTTGKLREMSEAQELTSDKLVKAFSDLNLTAELDKEFEQLPVTFDQAMTQVYNSALIVFSEFDRGGQFSTSIANFVMDGTEGFKNLGESAYEFGRQVSDTFSAIETIREALASMSSDGVLGFGALIDSTYSWRDALNDVLVGLDAVANSASNLLNAPGNALRLISGGRLGDPILNPFDMAGSFRRKTDAADLKARFDAAREASREAKNRGKVPPPFRAPAKKAKKGAAAKKPPRDRSDDVEFQFAQELRQAQMDVLRAQQSMAVTHAERARIAIELLDAERAMKEAELNDRVRRAERDFAEKKITAGALEQVKAQAEKLRAEYNSVDALERQQVANELAAQKAEDAAALVDSSYDLRLEQLQNEAALKETAAERREVELRILALMKEQERARLQAVIADTQSSELAKAQAQQRLDELDAIYAGREAGAKQGTRGPYEDWMASLPTTAAKMQEAFEQLQVQGFEGLIDAALELTNGFDDAGKALLNTLKQFFLGMARANLQGLLGNILPAGGFNLGSIFGSFGSGPKTSPPIFSPSNPGVGFAGGGSFTLRGIPGIDKNVMSINGIPIANVSYGEGVSISNDNQRSTGGGRVISQNFTVYANDADSFRRNERQIARDAKRRLAI